MWTFGLTNKELGEDSRKYMDIMQKVVNREGTVVEIEVDDVLAVSIIPQSLDIPGVIDQQLVIVFMNDYCLVCCRALQKGALYPPSG